MMTIPFTQFLMPDGRQRLGSIARPKAIADKAAAVIALGGRFTAEVLPTGQISLALEYDDTDYDLELTDNGPNVPVAVDTLVSRVYNSLIADSQEDGEA